MLSSGGLLVFHADSVNDAVLPLALPRLASRAGRLGLLGGALLLSAVLALPATAGVERELIEFLRANAGEKRGYTREEIDQIVPLWPNPLVSFLPAGADPDYAYWRARMKFESEDRRQEEEDAGGGAGQPVAQG